MTNDFLPEGYTVPSTSQYMKFLEGVNTFRILDKAIIGMEFWKTKEDGKRVPVRRKMNEPILKSELEVNPKTGEPESAKHFWAMPVWNYKDKQIQILEITQKTLQKAITGYSENPKWGNPTQYDITVTKKGTGKETEYLIDHDPKEPIDKEILKQYKEMNINLDALYKGENPFAEVDSLEKEIERMGEEEKVAEPKSEEMPF